MVIPTEIQELFRKFDALNVDTKKNTKLLQELREPIIDFISQHPDIEYQSEHYKFILDSVVKYEHPPEICALEKELKEKKAQSILLGTDLI